MSFCIFVGDVKPFFYKIDSTWTQSVAEFTLVDNSVSTYTENGLTKVSAADSEMDCIVWVRMSLKSF